MCIRDSLCYDTDEAGTKATLRAIEIFAKTDVRVKVLSLTGAKDPDEYIKNHGGGSEAFLQAAKKAVPATLFRKMCIRDRCSGRARIPPD